MPELLATVLAKAGMMLLEAVFARFVQVIFVAATTPAATAIA